MREKQIRHADAHLGRRDFLRLSAGAALGMASPPLAAAGLGSGPLRFGMLADVQYEDAPTRGSRHYRASLAKLEACTKDLNGQDLDFVIHLGDLIDGGEESFARVLPGFAPLRCPVHFVLGNHDFAVPSDVKPRVPEILGMPGRFYDFSAKGWRFVVLDGNDIGTLAPAQGAVGKARAEKYLSDLKARKAPNAATWNGAVGQKQLEWLRGALDNARQRSESVLLFCHFPVYPPNAHNLWNDTEILALIDRHACVKAYVNGHNHAGKYAQRNGVHYLTVNGMVETALTTAYGVATWDAETRVLSIDGTGRLRDQQWSCPQTIGRSGPAGTEGLP